MPRENDGEGERFGEWVESGWRVGEGTSLTLMTRGLPVIVGI